MVQVLAINGSPNMDKGNTALVLGPFLEGMDQAGARVELFYTKKLQINPCQGEFACWFKTPGRCFQPDDMQMLLPKIQAADIWVLAGPLYVDGLTGPLKNLLDRFIPIGQPIIELREGRCRHPARQGTKTGKLVLVSNCGFWEMENFDPLLAHIEAVCKNVNREFAGALLRPHGHVLRIMHEKGMPVDDVFDAARQAGRQLIADGKMSADTLARISRPLMPQEMYVQTANQHIKQVLEALEKK